MDPVEEKTVAEQLAEIAEEERVEAAAKKAKADLQTIARHKLRKSCEARFHGEEGLDFIIVEGLRGALYVFKKPEPVIWSAFQKGEKLQGDWERLYRSCADPIEQWERITVEIGEHPGVENAIVTGITGMLGYGAGVRLKK